MKKEDTNQSRKGINRIRRMVISQLCNRADSNLDRHLRVVEVECLKKNSNGVVFIENPLT